jgi:steroid 5-alpha reductase family enzyme
MEIINDPVFKRFFIASNLVALVCWMTTLFTNNFSQIDRLWSILPTVYAWCFFYTAYSYNHNWQRVLLMTSLITLWGIRLTYNYWRKGGYNKGEETIDGLM